MPVPVVMQAGFELEPLTGEAGIERRGADDGIRLAASCRRRAGKMPFQTACQTLAFAASVIMIGRARLDRAVSFYTARESNRPQKRLAAA